MARYLPVLRVPKKHQVVSLLTVAVSNNLVLLTKLV